MAATITTNTYVGPSDGWVQIAATAATFIRVSAYPHTHQFQLFFGSAAPSLVPVAGAGTVVFTTGVPTAGQTVTVGSEVYTFRASATLPFEVAIAASNLLTAVNFAAVVNSTSTLVTAANVSGTVTLTAVAAGAQGNYALSKTASNVTVSGAALTGGLDVVDGITVCHKPFWINQLTSQPLFAKVVNPVPNSNRRDGKLRLDTVVTS